MILQQGGLVVPQTAPRPCSSLHIRCQLCGNGAAPTRLGRSFMQHSCTMSGFPLNTHAALLITAACSVHRWSMWPTEEKQEDKMEAIFTQTTGLFLSHLDNKHWEIFLYLSLMNNIVDITWECCQNSQIGYFQFRKADSIIIPAPTGFTVPVSFQVDAWKPQFKHKRQQKKSIQFRMNSRQTKQLYSDTVFDIM